MQLRFTEGFLRHNPRRELMVELSGWERLQTEENHVISIPLTNACGKKHSLDLLPTRNIQICADHSFPHSRVACLNFLSPEPINHLQHVTDILTRGQGEHPQLYNKNV